MGVAAEAAPPIDAARPVRGPHGIVVALFALTGMVGSGLLFVVVPMVTKMLLPAYGGSPAVWTTSMCFFQFMILAGLAYSHWSQRLLGARIRLLTQIPLAVSPLFVLPFAPPAWSGVFGPTPPVLRLLLALTVAVGAPIAALSTMGPLIQRWYSSSGLPRSDDPY